MINCPNAITRQCILNAYDNTTLGWKDGVPMGHYSFDYAQNVHLPSDPMQCGPLYFLAPRNVGIFGVCAEGMA